MPPWPRPSPVSGSRRIPTTKTTSLPGRSASRSSSGTSSAGAAGKPPPPQGAPPPLLRRLARVWASPRTMLVAGSRGGESGTCRQAYGTEWARLMVLLQAMQGLGKPGVNIWGTTMGTPYNAAFRFPGYAAFGPNFLNGFARNNVENPVKQRVYRLLTPEASLSP